MKKINLCLFTLALFSFCHFGLADPLSYSTMVVENDSSIPLSLNTVLDSTSTQSVGIDAATQAKIYFNVTRLAPGANMTFTLATPCNPMTDDCMYSIRFIGQDPNTNLTLSYAFGLGTTKGSKTIAPPISLKTVAPTAWSCDATNSNCQTLAANMPKKQ